MSSREDKPDKHFPLIAHNNLLRKLLASPRRFVAPFVSSGKAAANLGCGPGFFTLAMAEFVGPEGRVYAVDSDEKAIRALKKKADKRGYANIVAQVSSASDLSFIKNVSVDFILAHGLLCSMAPRHRESAVNEMRRILKPGGKAYISVAKGPWSYVSQDGWEKILEQFHVERRGGGSSWIADRWAIVSL